MTALAGHTKAARLDWGRAASGVLIGVLGLTLGVELLLLLYTLPIYPGWAGHDFTLYRDAASSWLAGTGFYHPYQFAPYVITEREILYPPTSLILFAPFTVLPAVLWWAIPLAILGWSIRQARGWRLAAVLLCLTFPLAHGVSWSLDMIVNGNPVIWAAAGVALAVRFGVGPLALLKPSPFLLPFALIGIRSRAWWLTLAALILVSLPFLPMWLDYGRVLLNSSGADIGYMVYSVPLMLVPVCGRATPP